MLDWLQQNWSVIYFGGAVIGFALVSLVTFIAIWVFAASRYALGGLVLGWIPAGIAAPIAGLVLGFGWPLIVGALLLWGSAILSLIDEFAATRR